MGLIACLLNRCTFSLARKENKEIGRKKMDSSHPAFQGHSRSLELYGSMILFILVIHSNHAERGEATVCRCNTLQ